MISSDQKKRIDKIYKEKIYFLNFEKKDCPNNSDEKHLKGVFYISGSTRNVYDVSFFDKKDEKTFACNCPDHKLRGMSDKLVCKHICFLYLKVGKFLDVNFFENNKLREDQWEDLYEKMNHLQENRSGMSDVINDELLSKFDSMSLMKDSDKDVVDIFQVCKKEFDKKSDCPICFDDFQDSKVDVVFCPCCSNGIHKHCIEKWLESKKTCVYCRSEVWKDYGKIVHKIVKKGDYVVL